MSIISSSTSSSSSSVSGSSTTTTQASLNLDGVECTQDKTCTQNGKPVLWDNICDCPSHAGWIASTVVLGLLFGVSFWCLVESTK